MLPKIIVLVSFLLYYLAYRWYAGLLDKKIFQLRNTRDTPAWKQNDGVDYVPTRPSVLLGHHFASIAGLGPILGPAVAVIWGWLPALVWVIFGAIFIGAVHDFSALVLSVRAKGLSIGSLTESLLGKRARLLFLLIIFFLVSLAMGVFVIVLGFLFSPAGYPAVTAPSSLIMIVAMILGYLTFKKGYSLIKWGSLAFVVILAVIFLSESGIITEQTGVNFSNVQISSDSFMIIMLFYAFAASVLPVWLLLQSRDFLNSILLFLGLGCLYLGFFFTSTEFSAPALQLAPENAPDVFPFLFITIACGSISGFHALVSSGTTAKQLSTEKDAKLIGYGSMLGESLLGLLAILATTTVFSSQDEWKMYYGDWKSLAGLGNQVQIFIKGGGKFLTSLGLSLNIGESLLAFLVVSFALTSLDSATRLLRYNIEELSEYVPAKKLKSILQNRYISSIIAVISIGFFAFFKMNGQPAGKVLWQLFGTSNQLLGGLALLLASVYLYSRNKNPLYTLIPMILILNLSLIAMGENMIKFTRMPGAHLLFIVNGILMVLTGWLSIEGILAARRFKNNKIVSLDILT